MNRMRELRLKRNLNMKEVAKALDIPYTTYVNYEKGAREPNSEMLVKIANFFEVSIDYLLKRNSSALIVQGNNTDQQTEYDNIFNIKKQRIPLLGDIACEQPIFASEDRESYVEVGTDIRADFCLKAKGDSMINARILSGDIVFIRQQPMVENGEIAAVIIGDEATLKRVYYNQSEGKLILQAENPAYAPLVYIGTELDRVKILGKAIAFQSNVI